MPIYAIGDVQGCFEQLQQLLEKIKFNSASDILWFTGDLVNRGPQSLETLRFVKSLGDKQITVLGNHDLHLLAVACGAKEKNAQDTLEAILAAPDREELIQWLSRRPLFFYDEHNEYALVHAGLAPSWSLQQAKSLAQEVESALQSDAQYLLKNMYGDQPDRWSDSLTGIERLRCIINYFTRLRYCYEDGRINLSYKGTIVDRPAGLIPWFMLPARVSKNNKIIFGHWASLGGEIDISNIYPLDTGCVWNNFLTAMRLEDKKHFKVECIKVK